VAEDEGQKLIEILPDCDTAAVGYSGGVDCVFLQPLVGRVLGHGQRRYQP
jgi:PP-loop superfamily ATP-utilizing enzyme